MLTNFATPLAEVGGMANMRREGNAFLSHPFGYVSHIKTMDSAENNWDPMNISS